MKLCTTFYKKFHVVTSQSHQNPVEFWWQFHRIIPSINLNIFSMAECHWIQSNSNEIPIRFFYGHWFIFETCNAIKMQWQSHFIFLAFDGPKIFELCWFLWRQMSWHSHRNPLHLIIRETKLSSKRREKIRVTFFTGVHAYEWVIDVK